MPIRAVKTVLTRLGLDRPREATDVYQLSLHLGTSYRGTLRHLVNLRMLAPGVAKTWASIPPARLRAMICGQRHDLPARVWELTTLSDGSRLAVEVGDRLILRAPWLGNTPRLLGPDTVRMRDEPTALVAGEGAEFDVERHLDAEVTLTVGSTSGGDAWSVTLLATPRGHEGLIGTARPARAAVVADGARP